MKMDSLNILIVGVGGQGTLLTSKILGNLALKNSYDVKVSEVHGMSQRGGSVVTYVKMGEKVYSPVIEKGEADLILSFEKLEALRWIDYVKKDGIVILNSQQINPMPVITGKEVYPEGIIANIRKNVETFCEIDALELAMEAGNIKTVNTVLLGVVAKSLEFPKDLWIESLEEVVPKKFLDVNLRAFELGYSKIKTCKFEL
jgi:indolepyruvate ferredoxin oxidoreductase, beta subunit